MPCEKPPMRRWRRRGEPDAVEHGVDPANGTRMAEARMRRWLRAVRPGWPTVGSIIAPTCRLGSGRSR